MVFDEVFNQTLGPSNSLVSSVGNVKGSVMLTILPYFCNVQINYYRSMVLLNPAKSIKEGGLQFIYSGEKVIKSI